MIFISFYRTHFENRFSMNPPTPVAGRRRCCLRKEKVCPMIGKPMFPGGSILEIPAFSFLMEESKTMRRSVAGMITATAATNGSIFHSQLLLERAEEPSSPFYRIYCFV